MNRWDKTLRRVAAILVGLLTFAAAVATAGADQPTADQVSRVTNQVSESIESPYCPGQSLAMCPSANAAETRQDVQEMARQGMEAEEIKRVLVERYGEGYEFIEPPVSDQMTLLGGIVGGLAIAIGVVGFLARRRLSDDPAEDAANDELSPTADGTGEGEPELADDEEAYLEQLRAEYRD